MRNYPVEYLLLFIRADIVDITCPMQLGLAPIVTFTTIEHLVNIKCLVAAFKLILLFRLNRRCMGMKSTVSHLRNWVIVLASIAPNQI